MDSLRAEDTSDYRMDSLEDRSFPTMKCPAMTTQLKVGLKTDGSPKQNSIHLDDTYFGNSIWNYNSFKPFTKYNYQICLPDDGCATLRVVDVQGDGLVGEGG